MAVIAFIPIRGGSQSIPLKNIKNFCGYPLVYWNLLALEQSPEVDKVIVATDYDEIERVVESVKFSKVSIYRRLRENATDVASTESVMLEYLERRGNDLKESDIFMLVQATSPLTQSIHFSEAIKMYEKGAYDSILSCVKIKRFYWHGNGTPVNYDYMNRPRRQDFDGIMMENGAFYINTVANILKAGNRLSGRIGIYEMPEYTSIELDNQDDWLLAENLMYKYVCTAESKLRRKVRLFIADVDGVLTDGSMYYSEKGDELKRFHTYDGMAFKILREAGIKTAIITSENTKMVENRAKKMQIDFVIQGASHGGKVEAARELCEKLGVPMDETVYIGDDINCYELLKEVGIAACPDNAVQKIKLIPGIIRLSRKGGEGVVRELVDSLRLNSDEK